MEKIDLNLDLQVEFNYVEPHCGGTDEYGNEEILGGYWQVKSVFYNDNDITSILTQADIEAIESFKQHGTLEEINN